MSMFANTKEKMKKIKGVEWALLLVVLGLAGSLLVAPAVDLLGAKPNAEEQVSLSDPLETRIAKILSNMEGAGKTEIVIYYAQTVQAQTNWLEPATRTDSIPVGAVVIAEGADNIMVRLNLSRAVQTLLQLAPDAVEIFKMGNEVKEE